MDIETSRELTLVIPKNAHEALKNIAASCKDDLGRAIPVAVFARNLFLSALQGVIESLEAQDQQQVTGTPPIEERH